MKETYYLTKSTEDLNKIEGCPCPLCQDSENKREDSGVNFFQRKRNKLELARKKGILSKRESEIYEFILEIEKDKLELEKKKDTLSEEEKIRYDYILEEEKREDDVSTEDLERIRLVWKLLCDGEEKDLEVDKGQETNQKPNEKSLPVKEIPEKSKRGRRKEELTGYIGGKASIISRFESLSMHVKKDISARFNLKDVSNLDQKFNFFRLLISDIQKNILEEILEGDEEYTSLEETVVALEKRSIEVLRSRLEHLNESIDSEVNYIEGSQINSVAKKGENSLFSSLIISLKEQYRLLEILAPSRDLNIHKTWNINRADNNQGRENIDDDVRTIENAEDSQKILGEEKTELFDDFPSYSFPLGSTDDEMVGDNKGGIVSENKEDKIKSKYLQDYNNCLNKRAKQVVAIEKLFEQKLNSCNKAFDRNKKQRELIEETQRTYLRDQLREGKVYYREISVSTIEKELKETPLFLKLMEEIEKEEGPHMQEEAVRICVSDELSGALKKRNPKVQGLDGELRNFNDLSNNEQVAFINNIIESPKGQEIVRDKIVEIFGNQDTPIDRDVKNKVKKIYLQIKQDQTFEVLHDVQASEVEQNATSDVTSIDLRGADVINKKEFLKVEKACKTLTEVAKQEKKKMDV